MCADMQANISQVMASVHMTWPVINKETPQPRPPLLPIPSPSPQPVLSPMEGGHVHVSCGSPLFLFKASQSVCHFLSDQCVHSASWEEGMWCARAADQIKVWADMSIRYSAALASCYYSHCVHVGCDAVQLCDLFSISQAVSVHTLSWGGNETGWALLVWLCAAHGRVPVFSWRVSASA